MFTIFNALLNVCLHQKTDLEWKYLNNFKLLSLKVKNPHKNIKGKEVTKPFNNAPDYIKPKILESVAKYKFLKFLRFPLSCFSFYYAIYWIFDFLHLTFWFNFIFLLDFVFSSAHFFFQMKAYSINCWLWSKENFPWAKLFLIKFE